MSSYATYLDQNIVTNLSSYTDSLYLVLSHPLSTYSVAFAEFDVSGLTSTITDFISSDGKTLTGATKVKGGNYTPPNEWIVKDCTVNLLQLKVFELLVNLQTNSKQPCSLSDYYNKYQYIPGINVNPTWIGSPTTNELGYSEGFTVWNVIVDLDKEFKKPLGDFRYSLSFSATQS